MTTPVHKIAIASRDGELVYHFGQADRFLIYEIAFQKSRYLETRTTTPACMEEPQEAGHNNRIARAADLISDCRAVLISRIGLGAGAILKEKGIIPVEVLVDVEEAIKQYLANLL